MIQLRHRQSSLCDAFWSEEVSDLWEPWMRVADHLLEDEVLLDCVYDAQAKRHKQSRTRGRKQTPAEVVLRLLLLKHARNWSYDVLEREVRANLVYRDFTRIGSQKVPDAKTLVRIGQALGPRVIEQLHGRIVNLACEHKVIRGGRLRVDTTVVETNVHYPTDSSLLADGARVLTRTMKRVRETVGGLKTKLRNRLRTIGKKALRITLSAKQKDERAEERRQQTYREMISVTRNIVNQAKRVLEEVKKCRRSKIKGLRQQLQTMVGRTEQVIRQTKARVFGGNTHATEKLVSVFEPHTEIIRKGKANRPTEFGNLVKIQEAEQQIITHYEVFAERPSDSALLVPAVEAHQQQLGKTPKMVAADAGFYSAANEKALQEMGVRRISVPNRNTRSEERRRMQKSRWFRRGQNWRTGCEGRISALKRRHGLRRCLYRGFAGMQRWVGLGVIADNLMNIASHLNQASVGS
jgi:IS5 family transposase